MTEDAGSETAEAGAHPAGQAELSALFAAITARYGSQAASEIWLEVFGSHDAGAPT